MYKVILLLIFAADVFGFEMVNQQNLLGIMNEDQKVLVKGNVNITRKLTPCAKNKGWLQPFRPVDGVTPINEIDILNVIGDKDIVLVDMRKEIQYLEGTIPTSINVPYTTIEHNLDKLGCVKRTGGWDCSGAKVVYGFCNGPVCLQSPKAIRKMVENGYPVEKIYYYRGGMFDWEGLGLTTVMGNDFLKPTY